MDDEFEESFVSAEDVILEANDSFHSIEDNDSNRESLADAEINSVSTSMSNVDSDSSLDSVEAGEIVAIVSARRPYRYGVVRTMRQRFSELRRSKTKKFTYFDKSLPSEHHYLGDALQSVSVPPAVDESSDLLGLPILKLRFVLMPYQCIPLHFTTSREVATIRSSDNNLFGVIPSHLSNTFGTTARIVSLNEITDGPVPEVRLIAEGQQRFSVIDTKRTITGVITARVRLLSHDYLSSSFDEGIFNRVESSHQIACRLKPELRPLSSRIINVPVWLQRYYDRELITIRIRKLLSLWQNLHEISPPVADTTRFSFWLAVNLPISDENKFQFFKLNSTLQRLLLAEQFLHKSTKLLCIGCGREVADTTSIFFMSAAGSFEAYVNPHGHLHETLTVRATSGTRLTSPCSTEASWFPGYGWSILGCGDCFHHLGWRFDAIRADLFPPYFFGLSRASLQSAS